METAPRRPSWSSAAPFLAASVAIVCALQWHGNAYGADLSANPDEAAHFVTGLMARDYLLHFPWPAPMRFAQDFYGSYPLIGIGHWPPLFYLAQALWMAVFGGTVASTLVLMALITAATTTVLVRFSQSQVGGRIAAGVGVLFLITPLVQRYSRVVMAEMPLTLLALLAAIIYARYLCTRRTADAVWFGIIASAAIMTKPNGLALALLPPFAVLFARQTRIVSERAFWIPAVIVLAVCGPWYALTARAASDGWSASYDPSWLLSNPVTANATDTVALAGVPMFVLAGIGAYLALTARDEPGSDARHRYDAAAMAALALSTWIFVSLILPVRGNRHLLPLVPPILIFAGVAIRRIAGSGTARWRNVAAATAAIIAIAPLAMQAGRVPMKAAAGSAPVVADIESDRELDSATILVSSEGYGEGIFIAALAAQDRRPQHQVLRASQVLSESNWSGSDYRLAYATEDEVAAALRRLNVRAIVIDARPSTGPHAPHHQQLLGVLSRSPAQWQVQPGPPGGFTLFRAMPDKR